MIQTLTKPAQTAAQSDSTIALFDSETAAPASIQWLTSGKPMLEGPGLEGVETSLSHDDQMCLCVVGQGPQGCDIEPISERTRSGWLSILTQKQESLLQNLINSGDSLDIAGTRIWAAMEALYKATDVKTEAQLTVERRYGDTILFGGTVANQYLYVLSAPVQFKQGPKRIVSMVVTKKK